MPKIQWAGLPPALRDHLFERLRERKITAEDLYQLKLWRESEPDAPDGLWYKDFGSFKICGEGKVSEDLSPRWTGGEGEEALGLDHLDRRRHPSMVRMMIEVPEGALASLHQDPQGFAREMKLAAAAKWYELKLVSQGRAAEIAGISRAEFLDALARFGVSPFQYDADELLEEAGRG